MEITTKVWVLGLEFGKKELERWTRRRGWSWGAAIISFQIYSLVSSVKSLEILWELGVGDLFVWRIYSQIVLGGARAKIWCKQTHPKTQAFKEYNSTSSLVSFQCLHLSLGFL